VPFVVNGAFSFDISLDTEPRMLYNIYQTRRIEWQNAGDRRQEIEGKRPKAKVQGQNATDERPCH